jgi:hypothetical protein
MRAASILANCFISALSEIFAMPRIKARARREDKAPLAPTILAREITPAVFMPVMAANSFSSLSIIFSNGGGLTDRRLSSFRNLSGRARTIGGCVVQRGFLNPPRNAKPISPANLFALRRWWRISTRFEIRLNAFQCIRIRRSPASLRGFLDFSQSLDGSLR